MIHKKYVHDFKGDGEVIVLLHGFLASSSYWSKLQPLLTNSGYRVVTIDLLGFGHAPKPKNLQYTYDDHVTYLHKIFGDLNLSKFTLIGHSMGALIASRYALLHPDLNALILLHPPLYKNTQEAQNTLRSTGKHYRFFLDSRFRELGWIAMRVLPFTRISPHGRAAREGSLRNVIESAQIFDDLEQMTTKTLLVIGSKDRHQYLTNITLFPLSRSVTISRHNVNHHSPFYKPNLVHDIVRTTID
ncbi:MAG TPA: alpha/beta hydrolase [Candidatus Saccharimonadales bacterium]|nr:alpha/beta hydrolase [Candidatus Saccharimonadales bacterium]